MDDRNKKMNLSLKKLVIPILRVNGFSGSIPHFRRIKEDSIDLITFQTDRNRGGFIIEIAKANNILFKTYWSKEIQVNDLTAHDLNKRMRIHPKGLLGNSSTMIGLGMMVVILMKNMMLFQEKLSIKYQKWKNCLL